MAFTIELRKPTIDQTAGILGFYAEYENAAKVLDSWSKLQAPTREQIESLITCVCFFVPEEQRDEARHQLLYTASMRDLGRVIGALPDLIKSA